MGALLARRRFAAITGSKFRIKFYLLFASSQQVGATAAATILFFMFLEQRTFFVNTGHYYLRVFFGLFCIGPFFRSFSYFSGLFCNGIFCMGLFCTDTVFIHVSKKLLTQVVSIVLEKKFYKKKLILRLVSSAIFLDLLNFSIQKKLF